MQVLEYEKLVVFTVVLDERVVIWPTWATKHLLCYVRLHGEPRGDRSSRPKLPILEL